MSRRLEQGAAGCTRRQAIWIVGESPNDSITEIQKDISRYKVVRRIDRTVFRALDMSDEEYRSYRRRSR